MADRGGPPPPQPKVNPAANKTATHSVLETKCLTFMRKTIEVKGRKGRICRSGLRQARAMHARNLWKLHGFPAIARGIGVKDDVIDQLRNETHRSIDIHHVHPARM